MHFLNKKLYQKGDNLHCMQYIAHVEETFFQCEGSNKIYLNNYSNGKKEATLM